MLVIADRKGEMHRRDAVGADDGRAAQLGRHPVRWLLDVSGPSCHGGSHLGFALLAEERIVRNHRPPAEGHVMGCHWVVVPHAIMVKAGVDKMEDLRGKSIAVSAPGSFPDMLARVALAKFNIAPSDVTLAAVGGDRDRYTALVGGVVDAAVVSNEYLPLASSKNLKMLLEGRDALPNFLRICMFSSGKVLAQRREDAIRYLSAQSKALRYALTHRDETIKLTAEATDA